MADDLKKQLRTISIYHGGLRLTPGSCWAGCCCMQKTAKGKRVAKRMARRRLNENVRRVSNAL